MRKYNRKKFELRNIEIHKNFINNADGSCLVSFGDTRVICTATIENDVAPWLKKSGNGWVTAEYGMLPRSTSSRNKREAKSGKQSGRTMEIQRLIGRSLRSVVDLKILGEKTILIDCDVIEADGGTRTASITGGFVALYLAIKKQMDNGLMTENPITDFVAALSCGVVNNEILVDLDYNEDSTAEVDANFVLTKKSGFAEVQVSGEENTFSSKTLVDMLKYTEKACEKIFKLQENVTK